LEGEIIVYRHMLGKSEIKKTIETSIKKTRTYVEKNQYVGSISIGKRQIELEKMTKSN
jgi:hypothetical protein